MRSNGVEIKLVYTPVRQPLRRTWHNVEIVLHNILPTPLVRFLCLKRNLQIKYAVYVQETLPYRIISISFSFFFLLFPIKFRFLAIP